MSEADIASLGFEINYGPVTQAEAALKSFGIASATTELTAEELTAALQAQIATLDANAQKLISVAVAAGSMTLAEAAASYNINVSTQSINLNHDAAVRLLASLDPLTAAQQKQSAAILEGQRLYEANALSLEANARIQKLAQDQFDRTTSKIDGTTAALARLKAAQEAATTQQGIADAFGFGGSGGAKENGAPRNAATSAFNDLPRMTIDPKTGEEIEKIGQKAQISRMGLVDLGRVAKDLGDGNLLYLGADAEQAAARLGLIGLISNPVIAGIGAMAVALTGLIALEEKGSEESAHLANVLQITGNYAGASVSQFHAMGQAIATDLSVPVGKVNQDLGILIQTGAFTAQTMELMTKNAVIMGEYTGQSSDKVVASLAKMKDGVSNFAFEWQEQYHGLTVAQISHIQLLEKEGENAQATLELNQDMYNYLGDQGPQKLGLLQQAWHGIENAISGAITALKNFGAEQDSVTKLSSIALAVEQDAAKVRDDIAKGIKQDPNNPYSDLAGLHREQAVLAAAQAEFDKTNPIAAQQRQEQTNNLKAAEGAFLNIKNNAKMANDEIAIFEKRVKDPATLAALKQYAGFTGSDEDFKAAEENRIRHKYDAAALKHTPMSQAQRFGVGTDQVSAEADQELQVASAYMQSSAAGDRLVGSIKAIKDAKDKKLEGDQAEARIAADENLQINKTIENNAQRMAQAREEQQIRSGLLAQEQAGVINSAQYNQQTSETIALLPYLTSLQAAQTDAQKAAAQAVYDAQKKILDQGYSDKTTQSLIANNELSKDQIALLNLKIQLQYTDQQQAAISLAMFQKRLELERAHPGSSNTLNGAIAIANAGTQASLNNQISNKFGGENIAAQEEAITNAQRQLNSAVQAGAVNLAQYNVALTHIQQMQLELTAGKSGHWTDAMIAGLHKLVDTGKTASQQLQDNFEQLFSSLENGFANSIGKAIVGAEDLKQGLHDAAQQGIGDFIAGLVKMGEQWVINKLLASTLGASSTLEGTAQATALALAWDPVATAVSIATFGAADVAASAAMTATYALGMVLGAPKAAGGWVHGPGGPTSDSVLTPTSDGEFVTRASVAQDPINARILEQMNAGKKFSAGYAAGGFVGNAPQIGSTSTSSSHQNIIHLDFSNANFAGANKDEIIDAIDERLNDVWAPAIIQTSVTGSLTAQGKINRRQRLNPSSANRNGR